MVVRIADEIMQAVIELVPDRPFNTADVIDVFQVEQPELWQEVVLKYGKGGKGAGRHYSAFSHISQTLNRLAKRDLLQKLAEYQDIPDGLNWGSPVIRYWTDNKPPKEQTNPETAIGPDDAVFWEGAKKLAFVNRYERSYSARKRCIEAHGVRCAACDLDFGKKYGARGEGFIHVHHLKPVHKADGPYKLDPVKDLVPVCPNCHAMIHRSDPQLSIEALRSILAVSPQ